LRRLHIASESIVPGGVKPDYCEGCRFDFAQPAYKGHESDCESLAQEGCFDVFPVSFSKTEVNAVNLTYDVVRTGTGTHSDGLWWIDSVFTVPDGVLLFPVLEPLYRLYSCWSAGPLNYCATLRSVVLHFFARWIAAWQVIAFQAEYNTFLRVHLRCVLIRLKTIQHTYRVHDFVVLVHRARYKIDKFRFKSPDLVSFLFICCVVVVYLWWVHTEGTYLQSDSIDTQSQSDMIGGGRSQLTVPAALLTEHTSWSAEPEDLKVSQFIYVAHLSVGAAKDLVEIHPEYTWCTIPIREVAEFLPQKALLEIATIQGLRCHSRQPISELRGSFDLHRCAKCETYATVFSPNVQPENGESNEVTPLDKKKLARMAKHAEKKRSHRRKKVIIEPSSARQRKKARLQVLEKAR
jgi:hypothetical protein